MTNAWDKATAAIVNALRDFERETGHVVRGIELVDIEITRMGDRRPQLQRTVRIESDPVPGTSWNP